MGSFFLSFLCLFRFAAKARGPWSSSSTLIPGKSWEGDLSWADRARRCSFFCPLRPIQFFFTLGRRWTTRPCSSRSGGFFRETTPISSCFECQGTEGWFSKAGSAESSTDRVSSWSYTSWRSPSRRDAVRLEVLFWFGKGPMFTGTGFSLSGRVWCIRSNSPVA